MPDIFSELKRIKAELKGTSSNAIAAPPRKAELPPGLSGVTPLRNTAAQVPRRTASTSNTPSKTSSTVGSGGNAPNPPNHRQVPVAANPQAAVGNALKAGIRPARPSGKPPVRQPVQEPRKTVMPTIRVAGRVPATPERVAVKLPEPVSRQFRPLPKGALTRQTLFRSPDDWISAGGRTQISEAGHVGALDIVIGLDFGTSYTKAAVGFRDKIFPVTWEGVSLCEPNYLLPSEYTQLDDGSLYIGQHPAARQDEIRSDLKLPFINPAVSSASIGRASVFVALVLRYVRAWVFRHHGSKLGRAHLRWQLNVGAPSDGLENARLVQAYRQLAATAWQRSMEASPQRLARAEEVQWTEREPLKDLVDLQVRPEFVAQMAGYMQSPQRQRGLHALVDVGGGTLDVVTFIVHQVDGEDTFPFLVPQVHALGTHGLIQNRFAGIETAMSANAVDELAPIASVPIFARATGLDERHVAGRDALFKFEIKRVITGVLDTTKNRRYRLSDAWHAGVRTFFTGGGSRYELYRDAVTTAKVPSAQGLLMMPLPPHKNLDGFSGGIDEYQRISVACGLAQDAFTLGRIVPAKEVENDHAVVSTGRSERLDRDELYPK